MRIVQFSIQRYRSIAETERLKLHDLTVLVGPNNEGKSNILQALVTCMRVLSRPETRLAPRVRRRISGERLRGDYDWERDFPRQLQSAQPEGRTNFNIDFELASSEIQEFEKAVGSKLNGILPIGLSFGPDSNFIFSVRKQQHSRTLSAKRSDIAAFVAERVHLQYIPANRTAEAAEQVVNEMITERFRLAEREPSYVEALEKIQEIQRPLLENAADTICSSLRQLLPDVRSVALELEEDRFRRPVRCRVVVDDGTATDLEFKGDGIQSLAALSLIRHASESQEQAGEFILAIEEPEAHLHPEAVHEIARVLRQTAGNQQVVLSTHSPLLVNRRAVGSNVIVEKARARAATSVTELREVLGVKVSDNLQHAEVVLLVEGAEDKVALQSILSERSSRIKTALEDDSLAVQGLFGGAKLPYALAQLQASLCGVHVFLDDDSTGREAAQRARDEGLLMPADQTFATYKGASESELEDLYTPSVYREAIRSAFNVDIDSPIMAKHGKGKWSKRMRLVFKATGQQWNTQVELDAKRLVGTAVSAQPAAAIAPEGSPVMDALVDALERKLHEARNGS